MPTPSNTELTPRQLQMLQELVNGLTPGEIAAKLGLKLCTVRAYLRQSRERLQAATLAQTVARAVTLGIVRDEG
jgi:DNA-binding NarL/FixJ family response regulator